MPTLDLLRREYARILANWGIDPASSTFNTEPRHDGSEHVEILPNGRMALIGTERGHETRRRETDDPDELLYWLFGGWAFWRGVDYELKHRHPTDDSRRVIFAKALDEIGKISSVWRDRMAAEHRAILRTHPFHDSLS